MGYYIQTPMNKGKAEYIARTYNGRIVSAPPPFGSEPDKAIICILDNGLFEAAGLCYSKDELWAFSHPDGRPRTWVVMDKSKAYELAGYKD